MSATSMEVEADHLMVSNTSGETNSATKTELEIPVTTSRSSREFKFLPKELRLSIWEELLPEPRIISLQIPVNNQLWVPVCFATSLVELEACNESREVFSKIYVQTFGTPETEATTWFSSKHDTLFLNNFTIRKMLCHLFSGGKIPIDFSAVKKLVLAKNAYTTPYLPPHDVAVEVLAILSLFQNLEVVTFAPQYPYPKQRNQDIFQQHELTGLVLMDHMNVERAYGYYWMRWTPEIDRSLAGFAEQSQLTTEATALSIEKDLKRQLKVENFNGDGRPPLARTLPRVEYRLITSSNHKKELDEAKRLFYRTKMQYYFDVKVATESAGMLETTVGATTEAEEVIRRVRLARGLGLDLPEGTSLSFNGVLINSGSVLLDVKGLCNGSILNLVVPEDHS